MYNYKASQAARRGKASRNNGEHSDNLKAFKDVVITVAFMAVVAIIMALFSSCSLTDAPTPKDWKEWWHDEPEPVEVDTDTIVPVDTCFDLIEYTDPAFVGGWWWVPDITADSFQLCVYPHCVNVAVGTDVTEHLKTLLNLYDPTLEYHVFVTDFNRIQFFAKGTNDVNKFRGKVWFRPDGFYSGFGFDINKQGIMSIGGMEYEEHLAMIDSLPSVRSFGFLNTNYDSLQYEKAALKLLGNCKVGRYLADFRHCAVPVSDSIITAFEEAGWDQVLHN